MNLKKNQIQSRRNGLVLSIPNTNITNNLMQRFKIKGENELVFDQPTAPTQGMVIEDRPLTGDATSASESIDEMI